MINYQIPSYAKSFNLGHRALASFFDGDGEIYRVEEKVDGSQASVTKRDGKLYFRSKGRAFTEENPDSLFVKFVAACQERSDLLRDGWIYRGEYLAKPKHNCLTYGRVPAGHFVIFDIEDAEGNLLNNSEINNEAARLGFDPVLLLMELSGGEAPPSLELLQSLLKQTSNLGGPTIEGVVIKRTKQLLFDAQTSKLMIAKYVSEAFKEDQRKDWRTSNPKRDDVIAVLVDRFTSKARLNKCVQQLDEIGQLDRSLKDIGLLIPKFGEDLLEDHAEDIKQALFDYFWPQIKRGVTKSVPQMYKDWLVEHQGDA